MGRMLLSLFVGLLFFLVNCDTAGRRNSKSWRSLPKPPADCAGLGDYGQRRLRQIGSMRKNELQSVVTTITRYAKDAELRVVSYQLSGGENTFFTLPKGASVRDGINLLKACIDDPLLKATKTTGRTEFSFGNPSDASSYVVKRTPEGRVRIEIYYPP